MAVGGEASAGPGEVDDPGARGLGEKRRILFLQERALVMKK